MGRSDDSTQPRSSFRDARVRDRRRVSWYSVDNELLDDFGPHIGLHGFAVYCALHVDDCVECIRWEHSHPLADRLPPRAGDELA